MPSPDNNPLRELYHAVQNKSPQNALELVRKSPEVAAAISKLVRSNEPVKYFDKNRGDSFYNIDQGQLSQVSASSKERVNDNESMLQLFPDIELAKQILIASIMSPKDMVKSDIVINVSESFLPTDLTTKLTSLVKTYMDREYELNKLPPAMLENALFKEGADIRAVLPESSIDEIINRNASLGMEHFGYNYKEKMQDLSEDGVRIRPLGILGSPSEKQPPIGSFALEQFGRNKQIPIINYQPHLNFRPMAGEESIGAEQLTQYLEITDNFNVLKLPTLVAKSNKAKVTSILGRKRFHLGNESFTNDNKPILSDRQAETLLFKGRKIDARPFVAIRTQDSTTRRSIGKPLLMKLPTESVIPIHVPGQPENHVGYFLLVDLEGNPVTRSTNMAHVQGLQQRLNEQNNSMSSFLLNKARRNLQSNDQRNITLDQAAKIYSDIVESDLIERLRNGLIGGNVKIGSNQEVYRIMLARTFANQYTRLVYIPAELVVYTAFKYYDNGIGKSLLDDLKVMTSIRAILLFARVMAMTKNSIAITHVDMELDPNDPDPTKTAEMAVSEIIKMRQQYFPLGINSPVDLVDWVQRAGFEFTFTGHPNLPNTKFNFETKQLQHNVPDDALDETLRKQTFMAIGIPPETVDNGFNGEFATTVVQNNLLLSKRVMQYQELFKPFLADMIRKIMQNDNILRRRLLELLQTEKDNIKEYMEEDIKEVMDKNPESFLDIVLEEFIATISVDLPRPDITTVETQTSAYKAYDDALTSGLDAHIDSAFATSDFAGKASELVDAIKAAYRAYFLRKWQTENGYLPELGMITEVDRDGKICHDLYDMMKDHTESIVRATTTFVKQVQTMKQAGDKDLESLDVQGGGGTDSSSGGSDEGSGDGMDFGMDFGMGGEGDADLGGDTGAATDETVPEDLTGATTDEDTTNKPPEDGTQEPGSELS